MLRNSTLAAVSALVLVVSPSALAAAEIACMAASRDIVVEHRRFTGDPPAHVFRVTNRTKASIYALVLGQGEQGGPTLPATATNAPTSIGVPAGWKGREIIDRDGERMRYVWTAEEVLARIRPTTSLSGFTVQLPALEEKQRADQAPLSQIPFTMFLADGTCRSGRVVSGA